MKIKNLLTTLALTATFLFIGNVGWGQATLPHYDGINYTVGQALQTQTGWTVLNSGDNILIESGSLNYTGLLASTGEKFSFDGSGIDAAKLFTQQTAGTVYFSFLINVTSLGSLNTTGGYFAGFTEGTSTTFGATVWTKADGSGGYMLGINPKTTAANTQWSTSLSLNTTYFVVIAYQIVSGATNDIVKLWLNPTPGSAEPSATLSATNGATDLANVNRILIRQDAATTTPFIQMDELRISTSWADVTPAPDTQAPVLVPASFIPADNATDVVINTTLTIPFDENIQKGTGSVRIKKASDDTEVFAIDVTTAAVSVTNATATVTLPSDLANSTDYYVNIDAGAFKDMANNDFAGLTDKTTWNFTTIGAATPTITLTAPNGGEKYYAGQDVTFTWTSANMDAENIKIEAYVRDGLTANWNWITIIPSTANDGSEGFTIPADSQYGTQYKIRVTGLTSSTADESDAAFTVIATPTISEIQTNATASASNYVGNIVKITGVVTATTTTNLYIQNGSGAWNGIYIYNNAAHSYVVGNEVSVEGTVDETNTITQLKTVTITKLNESVAVPAPIVLSTSAANAENYESVLVKVNKTECISGSAGTFVTNDGSGTLTAYKGLYSAFALTIGKVYNITGVMTWYTTGSIFELLPRNASDVYELSNDANIGLSELGGKSINDLAGLKVTDPATDAGATLFFYDFTGLKGISISALNANATLEVKLNGAVVDPANYADQALAENDVVVAKITSEDGTATNYYKVTLKLENRAITVTAPTGGQTYNTGDIVTITWTSTNVANVNIWAYVIAEDAYVKLNTTPISAATGTFDYTIKNGDAGIVYIGVADANDESFYAQSTGTVTVIDNVKPSILTRTPAVNKYGVAKAFALEINYDESITAGTGNLKIFKASDNTEVFSKTAAEFTITDKKASVSVTGLAYATTYYITIDAGLFKDNSNNGVEAVAVNDWKFTTMAQRGGDLFFSEYVEGTSNNKAVEIYNPTSEPINLSGYSVKASNNGLGWGITTSGADARYVLPLSGTLAPGDVFVIYNTAAGTEISSVGDLGVTFSSTANTPAGANTMSFNGNDALGLFNGTTLIDVFGAELLTTNFAVAGVTDAAIDHTIVRKSSVLKGNTDWTASAGTTADNSEWIVKNVNDFSFLGFHNMTLSSANTITAFSVENQVNTSIDANAKTILVTMPYGVALTSLTPTITLSYGAYTIPASGVAQDFSSAFQYTAIAMDGTTTVWTVTATNATASSAKEIVTFSIPNQTSSTIVAGTATVNVVMPTGTNLSSLTPSITVSPYATINPASGVTQNFTAAKQYTVTAQDGSTKVWTVNVSIGSSAPDQPFASFKAYPNPFSNEIRFDGAEIARVTITSIIGQVVMDKVVGGENMVETQNLSKGIYLVKFTNIKGESVLRKLVKE